MGNNELQKATMSQFLANPNTNAYVESVLGDKKNSFVASLTTIVKSNYALQNCDKQSILIAAVKATAMNLPLDPGLGRAYIIPYGTDAQMQIGAKGYIELALRSGQYQRINAMEIREGEYKGLDSFGEPYIQFLPIETREKKKIVGYWAGFRLTNGFEKQSYWDMEKLTNHAKKYSQGYKKFLKDGKSQSTAKSGSMESPWASSFDQMASKTVLKNLLSKYGILSIDMQNAVKYDSAVISINDQGEEEVKYIDNPTDITNSSPSLSKSNQELLLKNYSPELLKEALFNEELQDITELSDSDMDTFIGTCEKIKKDNNASSGDKPVESKQIELK